MNTLMTAAAAALVMGLTPTPAFAADAPAAAAPAKAAYSSAETDIGTLIDTPETKVILDKVLPGFSSNEQVAMARSMTLRAIQQYAPDKITTEALDQLDAELAKLPAK
jgi:hypothetical protein